MGTCRKELAEAVIKDMYEDSLKQALLKHGVKAQNFFATLNNDPLLDELYVRAQQSRAEMFMEQMVEIADTVEDAQRARNMIEVRSRYAAKMKPNKFGDRIDLNVNSTVDIRMALDSAANRMRQVLDITQQSELLTTGSQPAVATKAPILELDDLLE